jgi:DNA polymerase-3 subunit alpha
LGISDIDPIKHNLIFERFMNLYRKGCPDIDVDIMDSRRKEVINYLIDKYGIDNTCGIVAFHRIKIKQAIRDVGKILNYSDNVINLLCHSIPKEIEDNFATTFLNHDALRKNYESYKELFDLAINIINFPKTVSIHPAGIVLTKKKIYEHVPIYKLNDNEYVTQYTNDYLERFGVVKVDLLSLNTLTKIQTNLDTINKNHNITLTFETIPKIDRKTFAMLSKGENSNLFQMESYQMKKMLKEIKPQSIEDISIISALGRPGTQDLIPEYIKNRNNPNKIIYLSNATKDILKSTSNIMVYEEQLMQIVRSICN